MYKASYIIVIALFFVGVTNVSAATSAGLVNGLWFSTDPVTSFGETAVYSVLHNQTSEQIQGIATLVVDGEAVKATEVTIGKGDIKRVSIPYAFSTGSHKVHMSFTAGNSSKVTHTELAKKTIFVVTDTDGDGIQNTTDPDDDNDGLLDDEDDEPLVKNVLPKKTVNLTQGGKDLFTKIVTRESGEEKDGEVQATESVSTSTLSVTLAAIEESRKKAAAALAVYEEEQRNALAEIERKEQELPEIEGFENEKPLVEESKKREHQIAAVGASVAGVMISKAWMFYAELVVLTLGALHLIWIAIKRKFFSLGEEEE